MARDVANEVVDRVLRPLQNVTETKDGQWSAQCPCHDDSTNSLCIGIGDDGRVLIHCQAGCAVQDVVSTIGLEMWDLFPTNGHSNGNGHSGGFRRSNGRTRWEDYITAAYAYRLKNRELSFQSCRVEEPGKKKTFRARQPKHGGGWINNVDGVEPTLYRFPELVDEIESHPDHSPTVQIHEGEKDCDNAAKLGYIATTNPFGAGKWKAAYAEELRGCDVLVFPDNDKPGEKHSLQVARSLVGIARSTKFVRLPGLPEKGDLSDWLKAGGTKEQLDAIIAAAPVWEPKAATVDESEITNVDGDDPLGMAKIIGRIHNETDGWPRRIDQALFISDAHGIAWIASPSALFGWLHSCTGKSIVWHNKRAGLITKEELFSELRRTSKKYTAVEELPHEPQLPGHFYACKTPDPGDGKAVAALLDRFAPATDIDRDLLLAALATPLWGGGGGQRPAFVVTAQAGRGVGKSKVAQIIGHVFGGFLDFSAKDEMSEVKQRLLSPEGLVRRVALLDNVKSLRFSWSELESLITSPAISGKRMYVGEAARPNVLTWFITLNGAALSTDMAQRSVIIKLAIPQRSGVWESETVAYAIDNRQAIIGDLIAFLRQRPATLTKFSRWATWEQAILSRLPEPSDAQATILERQGAVDVEGEESAMLEEFFEDQLRRLGYDTDTDDVHIPGDVASRWFNWCNNEKLKTGAVTRIIKQLIDEGRTVNLQANPCKTHGRGVRWVGKNSDITALVKYDLLARLANRNSDHERSDRAHRALLDSCDPFTKREVVEGEE
jgi:hypothetical protein